MDCMSVPKVLALSDISRIALSAICAAAAVSPSRPAIKDALKLVMVFIYSLADIPAVLKAS